MSGQPWTGPGGWKVERVELTADAKRFGAQAHYRYHVSGINRYVAGWPEFSWSLPANALKDDGFDLSEVEIPVLESDDG